MRRFTSSTVALAIGLTRPRRFAQDAVEVARLGGDLAVALLQRLQVRDHHLGHLLLQVAVAHARRSAPASASPAHSLNAWKMFSRFSTPGPEGVEVHRGVGVRRGAHDLLPDDRRRIQQRHRVARARAPTCSSSSADRPAP